MLFFISCRSSLSACIDFSSQATAEIDKSSDSLTLPTCHQTSNEKGNPSDPSNRDQTNQASSSECKCAISYSELLQYGETSTSNIHLDFIFSFSEPILKLNHEKQTVYVNSKQIHTRLSYFHSLNTIRLLI